MTNRRELLCEQGGREAQPRVPEVARSLRPDPVSKEKLCRLSQQRPIGCVSIELIDWAAKRRGHSIEDLEGFLLDADYHLYRLRARKLVPVLAGAGLEGENVGAFPRDPDQASGQQAS